MQVWSFASGSDGNCYLVESEGTTLLVECGRPYAQVREFVQGVGIAPERLAGILLTHAHGDPSRSARYLSVTHRVPIYASRGTLGALSLDDPSLARPIESGKTYPIGQLDVKPFAVPHDCREPLGFRFEAGTGRVALATDLGWVPHNVARQFREVDLLILEANYDPPLQSALVEQRRPRAATPALLTGARASIHSRHMALHSSDDIRAEFIEFWRARGAHLQPSSSLIPFNDPTVLLTTAGMQQFVPYFLGRERPPHTRYVSVQKCFRTSDIDEVGDRSHLTFFEMLGNFSMGDYFKAEVIPWALEFSTQHLGLDESKLWITIHQSDDEANDIWPEAGIPQDRIKRFGYEHNWWGPPGKTGPCGPNSELYYEQGRGFGCGFPEDPPDCDCGRLEFWNLVFMQYNQDENRVRTLLPKKNVDTGMGIERAAVVAFGLESIYDTDLFRPIIRAAERIAGVSYGKEWETDYALRVLADHGRAMTFLVLDGVIPGNGGREYVLRRITRRAIRYGRRLGIERPFLTDLTDAVA